MEAKWKEKADAIDSKIVRTDAGLASSMDLLNDYKASLREAIEKEIRSTKSMRSNDKYGHIKLELTHEIKALQQVLILLDTVNPKN